MKHSFELEQDFLDHVAGTWKPACSCGWTGEVCNNTQEAHDRYLNHRDYEAHAEHDDDGIYDWRECPICHGPCLEGADSERTDCEECGSNLHFTGEHLNAGEYGL